MTSDLVMSGSYNYGLVALSILIECRGRTPQSISPDE
jgi:hypothetical protein